MAVGMLQVTIGSASTQFTATKTYACEVVIESDDGNSNPVFIGDSTVLSSTGIRLANSATVPGRLQLGPYSGIQPIDLSTLYAAGTQNEKVNILYITN